jgi:hypothetical protein
MWVPQAVAIGSNVSQTTAIEARKLQVSRATHKPIKGNLVLISPILHSQSVHGINKGLTNCGIPNAEDIITTVVRHMLHTVAANTHINTEPSIFITEPSTCVLHTDTHMLTAPSHLRGMLTLMTWSKISKHQTTDKSASLTEVNRNVAA